jgi:hypothetical protein
MKAQAPLNSNLDYWLNLRGDEVEKEYRNKPHGVIRYPRVRIKWGKYLGTAHSHSDHFRLDQVAQRASEIGYKFFAVTDHLATYKESEDQFGDVRLKHFDTFGRGRDVYLIRGAECHCMDEGQEVKMVILGYRNPKGNEKPIEPGQSLKETIERAKNLNGIIMTTSTFNRDSKGIDRQRLIKHLNDIDAVGVLDSAVGMLGLPLTRFYASDIRAEKFVREFNKAGVYELNSHNLDEIGVSGFYLKKEDLPCLTDPTQLLANPDLFTDQFRAVLRRGYGAVENTGGYFPAIAPLFNRKRGDVALKDMKEAQVRYATNFLRKIGSIVTGNGHDPK